MFLPINDTERTRYGDTPMTYLIIITCFVIWIFTEAVGLTEYEVLQYMMFFFLGTSPEFIVDQSGLGGITAITATFLHGGFFHVLFNMWALFVFGRRVEDACGPWRFLFFYLFCGATTALAFTVIHIDSPVPAIGASGAVYGVQAAYMLLYPGGRIRTLILAPFPIWPKIRAIWVVLFFFITELPMAYDVLVHDADYSVAHWGHLGGFFGALAIIFFMRPEAFRRYINHLPL